MMQHLAVRQHPKNPQFVCAILKSGGMTRSFIDLESLVDFLFFQHETHFSEWRQYYHQKKNGDDDDSCGDASESDDEKREERKEREKEKEEKKEEKKKK